MKKNLIIEILIYIISFTLYILFLFLNKDKGQFYIYKSSIIFVGYIIPTIHIIFILLKQLLIKSYIGSKYDSIMTYMIVIFFCVLSIFFRRLINEDIFNKLNILFWIIEPLIYVVCIIVGLILEKKDKSKAKEIRIKSNK